jgi:hypothetical protein
MSLMRFKFSSEIEEFAIYEMRISSEIFPSQMIIYLWIFRHVFATGSDARILEYEWVARDFLFDRFSHVYVFQLAFNELGSGEILKI